MPQKDLSLEIRSLNWLSEEAACWMPGSAKRLLIEARIAGARQTLLAGNLETGDGRALVAEVDSAWFVAKGGRLSR